MMSFEVAAREGIEQIANTKAGDCPFGQEWDWYNAYLQAYNNAYTLIAETVDQQTIRKLYPAMHKLEKRIKVITALGIIRGMLTREPEPDRSEWLQRRLKSRGLT